MEEIAQAFSEVFDIINHHEIELYDKIPKSFIKMIEENKDNSYKPQIDYSISINDQQLLADTRAILSLIYRDFLCSPEEKKRLLENDTREIQKLEKIREQERREKYNPENIFKQVELKEKIKQETSIAVIPKEKWYKKIFNTIKQIFKG